MKHQIIAIVISAMALIATSCQRGEGPVEVDYWHDFQDICVNMTNQPVTLEYYYNDSEYEAIVNTVCRKITIAAKDSLRQKGDVVSAIYSDSIRITFADGKQAFYKKELRDQSECRFYNSMNTSSYVERIQGEPTPVVIWFFYYINNMIYDQAR